MLPLLLPLCGCEKAEHAYERSLLVEHLSVRQRCRTTVFVEFVVVVRRSSVDFLEARSV